jgi:hypothetical protein
MRARRFQWNDIGQVLVFSEHFFAREALDTDRVNGPTGRNASALT